MRTLCWLIVLLFNLAIFATFAQSALKMHFPNIVIYLLFSLLFLAISCLLITARFHRVPFWGHRGMKLLCWAVPILWSLGCLDHGIISGLEFLTIIIVALPCWFSWRAFLFFTPKT
jgi:hypothetical protein